jgi:hypothetical protein
MNLKEAAHFQTGVYVSVPEICLPEGTSQAFKMRSSLDVSISLIVTVSK